MKVTESEAIQLKFFFRKDKNYFLSYFFRTVLEIALACSFLFYMTLYGHPILMQVNCPVLFLFCHLAVSQEKRVMCKVHGFWYECHGIPMKLYIVTLFGSAVLTGRVPKF